MPDFIPTLLISLRHLSERYINASFLYVYLHSDDNDDNDGDDDDDSDDDDCDDDDGDDDHRDDDYDIRDDS